MHTVELLLDERSEDRVRAQWEALRAAGLPSQADHPHPTNRPHLTVATAPFLPEQVRKRLHRVMEALPLSVEPGPLLHFAGRTEVLAHSVVPGPDLIDLHARVWACLISRADPEDLNPLHAPGRWVPHITLARSRTPGRLAPDALTRALLPTLPEVVRLVAARSYASADRSVTGL